MNRRETLSHTGPESDHARYMKEALAMVRKRERQYRQVTADDMLIPSLARQNEHFGWAKHLLAVSWYTPVG